MKTGKSVLVGGMMMQSLGEGGGVRWAGRSEESCTLEFTDIGAERSIVQGSGGFGRKIFDGDNKAVVEKPHVCLLSRW